MSLTILAELFGGKHRVKILKFFLFNTEEIYDRDSIEKTTKIPKATLTKELNALLKMGLIQKKTISKEIEDKRSGKIKKKRVDGYCTNQYFDYIRSLQRLLIKSAPVEEGKLQKQLEKSGKLDLIIVAGIFIQEDESALDLLVVGDRIKDGQLKQTIQTIESEMGSQINYAIFSTSDFRYRLSMYDRLIRDVLDYSHKKILDRIGIEE